MYLLIAIAAAFFFTIGGVFMKLSAGFSQPIPSMLVYLSFLIGASLQTYIMHNAHLGSTSILVLGLDATCTILFSVLIFREDYTTLTGTGIFLVVMGTVLLRAEI